MGRSRLPRLSRPPRLAVAAVVLTAGLGFVPAADQPARAAAATADSPALGASYGDDGGITFRVRSAAATRMTVELYDKATGTAPRGSVVLAEETDGTWSAAVGADELKEKYGIDGTVYYDYQGFISYRPTDRDRWDGS